MAEDSELNDAHTHHVDPDYVPEYHMEMDESGSCEMSITVTP